MIHFFHIPLHGGTEAEELNRFLAMHRIARVERALVQAGTASSWAVCVETIEGNAPLPSLPERRPRVDYREQFSAADFEIFRRLREVRNELATRSSVAPYLVFAKEMRARR